MKSQLGYSLVELLVALAVTSIVISGTYAGYSFFSHQQQKLLAQTEIERNVIRAMDLLTSDVRQAGFKDFYNINPMLPAQPISVAPSDIVIVYDDYDSNNVQYRALIHYYLQPYTPQGTNNTRNRLVRDWRKCNTQSGLCTITNSTTISGTPNGDPLLDWVTDFTVTTANPKLIGTYINQPQTIQFNLSVTAAKPIEGTDKTVTKSYVFLARAKNVSLVP